MKEEEEIFGKEEECVAIRELRVVGRKGGIGRESNLYLTDMGRSVCARGGKGEHKQVNEIWSENLQKNSFIEVIHCIILINKKIPRKS